MEETRVRMPRLAGSNARQVRAATGVVAVLLQLVATGCGGAESPAEPPRELFTGQRYALVALDGQTLPAPFVFEGYTYLVGAGTIEFVSADTLRWDLSQFTVVSPGAPILTAIVGSDGYRQTNRDSVEVGAQDFGSFTVSPWAYGQRVGDTLRWRTAEAVPSNPRAPSLFPSLLGIHAWVYQRQQ